jgi:hypothetical protein
VHAGGVDRESSDGAATVSTYTAPVNQAPGPRFVSRLFLVICNGLSFLLLLAPAASQQPRLFALLAGRELADPAAGEQVRDRWTPAPAEPLRSSITNKEVTRQTSRRSNDQLTIRRTTGKAPSFVVSGYAALWAPTGLVRAPPPRCAERSPPTRRAASSGAAQESN